MPGNYLASVVLISSEQRVRTGDLSRTLLYNIANDHDMQMTTQVTKSSASRLSSIDLARCSIGHGKEGANQSHNHTRDAGMPLVHMRCSSRDISKDLLVHV